MRRRSLIFFFALLSCSLVALWGAQPPSSQSAPTTVGSEQCRSCHEEQWKGFQSTVHGRAEMDESVLSAKAGCESCHGPGSLHVQAGGDRSDPGFASIGNFKTMKPDQASEACVQCHAAGEQLHWEQSTHAARDLSCVSCHSIHTAKGTAGAPLLKAADTNQLCLSCHKDKRAQLAKSAHMPLREGGMDCADCHNPHGSPADKQLRAASAHELCTTCHADKRGPFLWEHPPVRENCLTCHEPHGSNRDKVLAASRPFLCQSCHIATRHPSTLYDKPDLARNRIFNRSCTNCHSQIHGSNHPSGKTLLR